MKRTVRSCEPHASGRLRPVLGIAMLLLGLPVAAQTMKPSPPTPNRYPPPLPRRRGPEPPQLMFHAVTRVSLSGPLAEDPPQRLDGGVRLRTVAGALYVDPSTVPPTVSSAPPAATPSPVGSWVVSADGKRRYRTLPHGIVEAQRRSRWFRLRWRRLWRLRAPGAIPSPPLVFDRQVCFGGLSDLVTCVRAKNGHQLWAVDVGGRVSRPLALWQGPVAVRDGEPAATIRIKAVLVVPDHGNTLLALDPYDGRRLASFPPPGTGSRFLAPALNLPEGQIALAVQRYEPADAALLILRLETAGTGEKAGEEENKSKSVYNEVGEPAAGGGEEPRPTADTRRR